jgi:LPXTG-motif cell wall-anchored protein
VPDGFARIPAGLLKTLVYTGAPADAVRPQDSGLVLPQTGTDSRLMLIAGLFLMAVAGVLLRRERALRGARS